MTSTRIRTSAKSRDIAAGQTSRLVDDVLDRYVEWCEDAAAVDAAYRVWSGAPADEGMWRFSVYLASLEQEEFAANSYAAVVAELDQWSREVEGHLGLSLADYRPRSYDHTCD